MDGPAQVQGDQLNVAVFFQYPVKSVCLMLLCREAYTGKVTLYKIPKKTLPCLTGHPVNTGFQNGMEIISLV